jgi:hypothetical protein
MNGRTVARAVSGVNPSSDRNRSSSFAGPRRSASVPAASRAAVSRTACTIRRATRYSPNVACRNSYVWSL